MLWEHLFYSYHIGINEAAHAEERDRTQKRGKFGQNKANDLGYEITLARVKSQDEM